MRHLTVDQAVRIFGSQVGLADALGVTSARISQLRRHEVLPHYVSDRVVGAALRLGVLVSKREITRGQPVALKDVELGATRRPAKQD